MKQCSIPIPNQSTSYLHSAGMCRPKIPVAACSLPTPLLLEVSRVSRDYDSTSSGSQLLLVEARPGCRLETKETALRCFLFKTSMPVCVGLVVAILQLLQTIFSCHCHQSMYKEAAKKAGCPTNGASSFCADLWRRALGKYCKLRLQVLSVISKLSACTDLQEKGRPRFPSKCRNTVQSWIPYIPSK